MQNNDNKEALKSCPFCGGKAEYSSFREWGIEHHFVTCLNSCLERSFSRCTSKEEAIRIWNTRAKIKTV